MTARDELELGPARDARVERAGDRWTLIVVRALRHPPDKVWRALTEPEYLREWAPFDADRSLGTAGATVRLTTVGAPQPQVTETTVARAEAPRLLEFRWGDGNLRWELEPVEGGTRLTLWAQIGRRWVALGAAGWHLCLDVLDRFLGGAPIGRIVGPDAFGVPGFQRLHREYAAMFGVEEAN